MIEIRSEGETVLTQTLSDVVVPENGARSLLVPLDQALPADPEIEIRLTNRFSPQSKSGEKALPVYKVKTGDEIEAEATAGTEVADLSLPVGGLN